MRLKLTGSSLALCLLAPASAEASELHDDVLELRWDAPSDCPAKAAVLARVEQLLGGAPVGAAKVAATATVRRSEEQRYVLEMQTEVAGSRGTKTVEAPACAALGEAAAVFLALAIDSAKAGAEANGEGPSPPAAPGHASDPDAAEAPPSQSPPSGAPSDRPTPLPAAPQARPPVAAVRFGFGAAGFADVGSLPATSVGLALAADVRFAARYRAGLFGTIAHPQTAVFDPPTGAGASFDRRTLGLFTCYVAPLGAARRFHLGGCAGAEVVHVSAAGRGIRRPQTAEVVFPSVALGVAPEYALTRAVRLVARVEAVIAISAPDVALATDGGPASLFGPATIAGRARAGVEIVLP